METTNIIFSGVGGQGIILASRIVSQCAFLEGFDVKSNELHGMAQREGSVISHVRYGEKVYSPLVAKRKADFLVALEELEGLRYVNFLKPQARVVLNQRKKKPMILNPEQTPYPEDIKNQLELLGFQVDQLNAYEIARNAGSPKSENVVLLGILSAYLSFTIPVWEKVIKESVPVRTIDANLKAFRIGRDFVLNPVQPNIEKQEK